MLRALRQVLQSAQIAVERRRTARALLRMNDHLLTDIGLRRTDVELTALGLWPLSDDRATGGLPASSVAPRRAWLPVGRPTMQGCG